MLGVVRTKSLAFLILLLAVPGSANATLCVEQGEGLYVFYQLYQASRYVVLAKPIRQASGSLDAKRYNLVVSKSWRLAPASALTVVDPMPLTYFAGTRRFSETEQVFFLAHGRDERVHFACFSRAFPAKKGTVAALNQIQQAYASAEMLGDSPQGGIICVPPIQWRANANHKLPSYSIGVGNRPRKSASSTMSVFIADLDRSARHLMQIFRNEERIASFWFRFPEGEDQLCLQEIYGNWQVNERDCGCYWNDA